MPIHHAVLGLLERGPSYGYELKSKFEEAIGPQWGELNIGHLYQVLERLDREGLITGKVVTQTRRPDKTIYRLTKRGRAELGRWLEGPPARQSGYRDDFFLKLFVASQIGEERLRTVLARQRETSLAELGALGDLRSRHKRDPLVALLLEAATLHTEANIHLVDRAERRVSELVMAGAAEFASGDKAGGRPSEPRARRSVAK